jgi:F-box-like
VRKVTLSVFVIFFGISSINLGFAGGKEYIGQLSSQRECDGEIKACEGEEEFPKNFSHFASLPDEIQLEILRKLSVKDLLSIMSVSSSISDLARDENLWKEKTKILGLVRSGEESYYSTVKNYFLNITPLLNKWRADGILNGRYGYQKDRLTAHKLIEEGMNRGFTWVYKAMLGQDLLNDHKYTFKNKVGYYPISKNRAATYNLLKEEIKKGIEKRLSWAFEMKIDGLERGIFGYYSESKRLAIMSSLIEEGIKKEFSWALGMKFIGLSEGRNGYYKNLTAAHALLEEGIKNGFPSAFEWKFQCLLEGWFGFSQNTSAAYELLEEMTEKGFPWAVKMKIKCLNFDRKNLQKNSAIIHALIEKEIEKGTRWAFKKKCWGLFSGDYGYSRDPDAASALLKEGIEKGFPWALEWKFIGLAYGKYGYSKEPGAIRIFIESTLKTLGFEPILEDLPKSS